MPTAVQALRSLVFGREPPACIPPAFLAPGARPPTRRPGPATHVQELAGGLQDVGESDRRAADLQGPRLKRPERVLLPFICSVGQPAMPSRPTNRAVPE